MPCCKLCNSIQTASIIGRIIVAFSVIGIVLGFLRMAIPAITSGIFQAVMAGILIFGAQHRNRTALLFWMFVTILELIVSTTFLALVLIILIYPDFLRYVLLGFFWERKNSYSSKFVQLFFYLSILPVPLQSSTEGFQPSQNIIEKPRVYSFFFIIQIYFQALLFI